MTQVGAVGRREAPLPRHASRAAASPLPRSPQLAAAALAAAAGERAHLAAGSFGGREGDRDRDRQRQTERDREISAISRPYLGCLSLQEARRSVNACGLHRISLDSAGLQEQAVEPIRRGVHRPASHLAGQRAAARLPRAAPARLDQLQRRPPPLPVRSDERARPRGAAAARGRRAWGGARGEDAVFVQAPPLRVVVVGAGIAGLAAARQLRMWGHRPLVLEARKRIGG